MEEFPEKGDQSSPLATLRDEEEPLRSIVRSALERRDNLSSEARSALAYLLRQSGQVPGFRDQEAAPASILMPHLERIVRESDTALSFVVKIWHELHKAEVDAVTKYLDSHQAPKSPEDLDLLVESICSTSADLSHKLVQIALSVYPFIFEQPEANAEDENSMKEEDSPHPRRLQGWLDELMSLSPVATEWSHLDWFVNGLQALASQKHEESLVDRRVEELQRSISGLEEYSQVLAFLHLDVESWSAVSCHREQIEEISSQLGEFAEALAAYAVTTGDDLTTFDEVRKGQLKTLEGLDRIGGLHKAIDAVLNRPPEPPEKPGQGAVNAQTSESEERDQDEATTEDRVPEVVVRGGGHLSRCG